MKLREVFILTKTRTLWTRPFVVFSILLLFKIYFSSYIIFDSMLGIRPLLTGLPTICVFILLVELLVRKRKLLAYMILNGLVTFILFGTVMYYKYYGVIVTHHAFKQIGQLGDVKSSVFDILKPYYLIIFVDILILLILIVSSHKVRNWGRTRIRVKPVYICGALAVVLFMSLATILTNKNIVNELKMAEQMGTLNYQLYSIIAKPTVAKPTQHKVEPTTVTQDKVLATKQITNSDIPEHMGEAAGKNIIMIQLESFQDFLIGLSIGGQEITPVLNDLLSGSYYFSNFYQQIGQGNTSDAEYLVNTSLYVPPEGAASQTYSDRQLPSLPRLLKDVGYRSLTFHVNDVTFWDRDKLYPALGFDQYYDRDFFGSKDQIGMGSSDEVLFAKTADELAKLQDDNQKFYAHVISMSNHHPFELPNSKNPIPLPNEYDDTLVGNYLQTAHYTDYALGTFIDKLKESGVWENSMVVIYGDHVGLPMNSLKANEKQLLAELTGKEYNYSEMFNIPLMITVPGVSNGATFEQLGGQVDVMPTIANLAGLSLQNRIYFGQDLLNHEENLLPMRYYLPTGSFINEEAVFVPGKDIQDGTSYLLKQPSAFTEQHQLEFDYQRASQLLQMSDSYVRSLPFR